MTSSVRIPAGLKDFGKELFATFLGILLALGLGQWRAGVNERHATEAAMQAVTAELKMNHENIRKQISRCTASLESVGLLEARLKAMSRARSRGAAPDLAPFDHPMGMALTFTPDAWEALKGQGLLRCLPQDKVLRLSSFYRRALALPEMARDNFSGGGGLTSATVHLGQGPEAWARLSKTEFEQFQEGVQLMRAYFSWAAHELAFLQEANERALLP